METGFTAGVGNMSFSACCGIAASTALVFRDNEQKLWELKSSIFPTPSLERGLEWKMGRDSKINYWHSPAVVDKQAEQNKYQQCQGTQDGEQEDGMMCGNVSYTCRCTHQP